jgi:hypothetical protein
MLEFDSFMSDPYDNCCFVWASRPDGKRARFTISSEILVEVLGGGNPVHDRQNRDLCERARAKIEAACRHAYAARPTSVVELQPADFCHCQ